MKAIVQDRYGSVDGLRVSEVALPRMGDDDVLVRVHAASVNPDVWHVVTGQPYVLRLMGSGVFKPKNPIPGTDVAGEVEAIGKNVTRFQRGDAVFGESLSGHQWQNGGAYAEFVALPERHLAKKPEKVTFEQAASVATAGLIALNNLRGAAQPKPGQKVLVNGAAGGVGSIALQLAKAAGANVTAVDSTHKLPLLRALGADQVIDYTQVDFTQTGERYDLIVDVPCNYSFSKCCRALTPKGFYVFIGHDHFGVRGQRIFGSVPAALGLVARTLFNKHLPREAFSLLPKQESTLALASLLEAGLLTPIVAQTYSLSDVPAALRALEQGAALGRLVITPRA